MNILTYDIEDWFHLLDLESTAIYSNWDKFAPRIHANVDRLIDITLKYNHKATFFCLGWIAEKYPEIIRRIDAEGFEIGSHSFSHQLAYQQTPIQFRQDVVRSIQTLEDLIGKKVTSFRAPGFSIIPRMPWAFETLIELGIECDSSIFPASRAHGGFTEFGTAQPAVIDCAGGSLREFPISLSSMLGRKFVSSGGGYFRLLPYWLIKRFNRQSDYLMTYFHPRDFDPGQPRIDMPLFRKFKSYVGLNVAEAKLESLLADHVFTDLRSVVEQIDWRAVPRIKII
jgi:polysaccharide deacetylase family protein (PEP-CTERM system associated)